MVTTIERTIRDIMVNRLPQLGRRLSLVLCVLLFAVVVYIGYITTYEVNCSLLYMLPVAILTQVFGLRGGIAMSFAASLARMTTNELTGIHYSNHVYLVLDFTATLLMFSCLAFLLNVMLKAYREERLTSRLDELTQIPNRRFLYEHAEIEIARCIRNKETFNVLAIDCDDFKKINDTLGHLTGDKVLQVVAQTLQNNLRKADILARMGGDEFTILLSEIDPSNARKVALKLYKQLTGAMLAHGWPVGFSLGLASCSNLENVTLEELLHKADIAMYESKVNETDITEVSSC